MPKIEWTERRVRAFEEARSKGMKQYIIKEGLKKATPLYFVLMLVFAGFIEDWHLQSILFAIPVLALCSIGFGYFVTKWIWHIYDRSYRDYIASKSQ